MRVAGKVIVVTGGANGIGRSLCRRFAADGARSVVVADVNADQARELAYEIGGIAVRTDVAHEADMQRLIKETEEQFGRIDLFCSNAGVGLDGGVEAPDPDWQKSWQVNVMAHVYAARAVLPGMLARGEGYLLQTVSAAGLLSQIGSAPYTVSKHAALGFAEWLSITYGDRGIKVSALCPMGVRTQMLAKAEFGGGSFLLDTALEPEQVADFVIKSLLEEKFLILPHSEVADFFSRKAADHDRWLRGMRRLQASTPLLKEVVHHRDSKPHS
jgi:NAD(P)-dependent dehydrogenase (short-subunit alcohol dehydrogenase family)